MYIPKPSRNPKGQKWTTFTPPATTLCRRYRGRVLLRRSQVANSFRELVGIDLTSSKREFQVGWLPNSRVNISVWRQNLIPELMSRLEGSAQRTSELEEYHPAEHRFRYAAWCAATASRSSRRVCTFSVERGANLLRGSSIRYLSLGAHWLPPADQFDTVHDRWCTEILERGRRDISPEGFSYGIAAKMVNCFTKTLFLNDMISSTSLCNQSLEDDRKNRATWLHPPVDRLLLEQLQKKNIGEARNEWRALKSKGWSRFDRETYQRAIALMKQASGGRPAQLEAFWIGHQSPGKKSTI